MDIGRLCCPVRSLVGENETIGRQRGGWGEGILHRQTSPLAYRAVSTVLATVTLLLTALQGVI